MATKPTEKFEMHNVLARLVRTKPEVILKAVDTTDSINTEYENLVESFNLQVDVPIDLITQYISLKSKLNIVPPYQLTTGPVKKLIIVTTLYNRKKTARFCIERICKRERIYKIIIVYSLDEDYENIKDLPNIHAVKHDNNPLNLKYQKGVTEAKQFDPDAILILGSDDIVSQEYIDKAHSCLNLGYQFIGTKQWMTCCFYKSSFAYTHTIYNKYRVHNDGIGAGRIISKTLLDTINWNLYNYATPENSNIHGKSYLHIKDHIPEDKMIFDIVYYPVICVKTRDEQKSLTLKSKKYLHYMIDHLNARNIETVGLFISNISHFIPYTRFIFDRFFLLPT